MPGRSVSMSDVARHAGVALGTVSNVLNHPHKVAEPTRLRILSAIDELGFVRNQQARSLALGHSHWIGMVVTDLGNSFFVDMARGAERAARERGMTLLLADSDNSLDVENGHLDVFAEARFAGIALAPFEASTEGIGRIRRHGQPVVLLNVAADVAEGCSVTVDNRHGGYLAARHLIDGGRRRLAFVSGPDRLEPLLERRLGVEQAVAESDGRVSLEEIFVSAVNSPEGRAIGAALSTRSPAARPDGIVAASDLLAMGMVHELSGVVRVPDDIAIIGYDDNAATRESSLPISTVAQPGYDVGAAAIDLLIEEIVDAATHRHRHVGLQPHVIVRASSSAR